MDDAGGMTLWEKARICPVEKVVVVVVVRVVASLLFFFPKSQSKIKAFDYNREINSEESTMTRSTFSPDNLTKLLGVNSSCLFLQSWYKHVHLFVVQVSTGDGKR